MYTWHGGNLLGPLVDGTAFVGDIDEANRASCPFWLQRFHGLDAVHAGAAPCGPQVEEKHNSGILPYHLFDEFLARAVGCVHHLHLGSRIAKPFYGKACRIVHCQQFLSVNCRNRIEVRFRYDFHTSYALGQIHGLCKSFHPFSYHPVDVVGMGIVQVFVVPHEVERASVLQKYQVGGMAVLHFDSTCLHTFKITT